MTSDTYFKHGSNLAAFRPVPGDREYWESLWASADLARVAEVAEQGLLGELEYPFATYLPKNDRILEAGCGTSKFVWALRARGYDVVGIDYANETIAKVRAVDPVIDVRVGNILALDFPSESIGGYISLGVLEHNFEGPHAALREAFRVLRPGGVALISVPYLNWPRKRLWKRVPDAPGPSAEGNLSFYQDHVHVGEFSNALEEVGFDVRERYPHILYGGLIRDWKLGKWLHERHWFSWRVSGFVKRLCKVAPAFVRRPFAHMMMFVSFKPR